jgi:hypothetical protein
VRPSPTWRAPLLVCGFLAACAALFLATHGDDDSDRVVLRGSTERGQRIALVLSDGRLDRVRTRVPVYCPVQRFWRSIRWRPVAGVFGLFEQHGPRVRVSQRADARRTASKRPQVTVLELEGRLAEDGKSARGTIDGRWQWEGSTCRAKVRFRAG